MTIDQLVPLTNGLSVSACHQTLALDGARVTAVSERFVDLAFRIAGTDLAPRVRLRRAWLASSSIDELARTFRHVASRAMCGE